MTGSRICSGCSGTEAVEWELAIVWRHDRSVTDGSRVIDARRTIAPEYLCNACAQLVRRGHAPQAGLFS